MVNAAASPVEFEPEKMTLSKELLQALTAGDAARVVELLTSDGQTKGHFAINVAVAPPPGPSSWHCLLGVTSNGNSALHLIASRGHAELAAIICEKKPGEMEKERPTTTTAPAATGRSSEQGGRESAQGERCHLTREAVAFCSKTSAGGRAR